MKKSLFIIRNPDSPLLKYIDFAKENYEAVLIHNAVYSEELRKINTVKILKEDADLRKIKAENQVVDYNEMVKMIFSSDKVICA
jgi:sulfur transfer complex TusBCD TusB component (DsrH family)|tara:strand:+ start:22609 stop:22860 length:252 start_codon:yes stop_codon:yes gene_type:complete